MDNNTFDSNLNICNLIEFSRIIKDLLNDLTTLHSMINYIIQLLIIKIILIY